MLRQEAGFGCCKCGSPIYDYHHIVPYEVDPHFRPEDMMILCPNHHREVRLGAMPVAEQLHYKANPCNRSRGLAEGTLKVFQSTLVIQLGSTVIVGDGITFDVDGFPLLQLHLSDERLVQISASLYDQNDNLLAVIDKNEWVSGDPLPWDIEFGARWITIRERWGRISLMVDARKFPMSVRGWLWYRNHSFHVNKTGITISEASLDISVANLGLVAQQLRIDTASQTLQVIPDERFGAGALVSQPAPLQRIVESVKAWQRLKYPSLVLRT